MKSKYLVRISGNRFVDVTNSTSLIHSDFRYDRTEDDGLTDVFVMKEQTCAYERMAAEMMSDFKRVIEGLNEFRSSINHRSINTFSDGIILGFVIGSVLSAIIYILI